MNAAVFLDRDNTIIHNDADLGDPDQVQLIQGAAASIASLCGLGYQVVVVSNQGGVARGRYTEADVALVHQRVSQLVSQGANGARIDRYYYCPFHPEGKIKKYRREHPGRKPQPGMLLVAADELDLDMSQSWMIGDQMRDVQAGAAAGVRTILLHSEADHLSPSDVAELSLAESELAGKADKPVEPDFVSRSIVEAVRIIAQQRKPDMPDDSVRGKVRGQHWDAAAVARLQQQHSEPRDDLKESGRDKSHEAPSSRRRQSPPPFKPWNAPEPQARREIHPRKAPVDHEKKVEPKPGATRPGDIAESAQPTKPPNAPPPTRELPTPSVPDTDTDTRKILRQILSELRHQRGSGADFSYAKVVAIVLQMIAALCLLGGLWMGANDAQIFLRWLGAGLMIQLAIIALLLYDR